MGHRARDAPCGVTRNYATLRTAREAESGLAREPLHVDHAPERKRVAPVVCIEGERPVVAGGERLLELVRRRTGEAGAPCLASAQGHLHPVTLVPTPAWPAP